MARSAARAGIDIPGRLQLVEEDLDRGDDRYETMEADFKAAMNALDARLGKIMWAMVGILISLTTTSVVLLLTVGVRS